MMIKKSLPLLTFFASFLWIFVATPTELLAKDIPFLNFPQTVHRMERRGWMLKNLQRVPNGSEDYFVAIYERKDPQEIGNRFLMIYHRETHGSVRVVETGKEAFLTPVRNIPRDLNGDGRPEVAVKFSTGGTGWEYTWLEIYTLADGKATRLISPRQGSLVLRDIQEIDGDTLPELLFTDTQWEFYGGICHACSPGVWHYMRWDVVEGRYKEDPKRLWMAYEEDIQQALARLEDEDFFQGYLGDALSVLLNYHLLGETERGWAEFESLLSNRPRFNPDDLYADTSYQREMLKEIRTDLSKKLEQSW